MAVVAVMLPSPVHLQRLQSAMRDRHELLSCADWDALARACETDAVSLAIVDLYATGKPELGRIRALKARYPGLAVVTYVSPSADRMRDLFDAGRVGVDGLVLANVDDSPRSLLTLIDQAERRGVAGLTARALTGVDAGDERGLSPTVRDALLLAVTRAHARLSPQSLAETLGITRRHLARELVNAGFPPPQRLISWGRLIVAGHMLQGRKRRADAVARTLTFPSGSAFRNLCQYYVHATPHQIRVRGGAGYVLRVLLRQVADQRRVAAGAPRPSGSRRRELHLAV